jgi:hypothetical protein
VRGQRGDRPVVVEPGERGEPLDGDVRRVRRRDERLVFAGLPTTTILTSDPAPAFSARPASAKITALVPSSRPRRAHTADGNSSSRSVTGTPRPSRAPAPIRKSAA